MKVVVDTNVFISSFINPKGTPRKIIDLWKKGEVILCLSAEILEEYIEVLSRFGLADGPEMKELLDLFKQDTFIELAVCDERLNVIDADPDDNKFIECAVAAKAGHIISGDRHLRDLGHYEGITVVSPAQFLALFSDKDEHKKLRR